MCLVCLAVRFEKSRAQLEGAKEKVLKDTHLPSMDCSKCIANFLQACDLCLSTFRRVDVAIEHFDLKRSFVGEDFYMRDIFVACLWKYLFHTEGTVSIFSLVWCACECESFELLALCA